MKFLKHVSTIFCFLFIALSAKTEPQEKADFGTNSGGGGDPYAQQFIDLGYKLAEYFKQNPFNLALSFKADQFKSKIKIIDESVKDEGVPDRIEFTDTKLVDKSGVEKPAVFDATTNSVRVNRRAWTNYTIAEKLIQVTMEITGLLEVPLRYENAEALVQNHAAAIYRIVTNEKAEYNIPGWRIAGQDPGQFAKITEGDVLIDAGTLPNKKALQFLSNPHSQPEWLEHIISSWVKIDKAYFTVASSNYDRAAVTVFYIANEGKLYETAYTLHFKRVGNLFNGPCATPEKLKTLERIQACYLNPSVYSVSDSISQRLIAQDNTQETVENKFREVTQELKEQIHYSFARNAETMMEVLREYFITDYSRTIIPSRLNGHNLVLQAAPGAHGLQSSLEFNSELIPFWQKTMDVSLEDLKLYEAARALAKNDLVFLDFNFHCPEIKTPALVNRKMFSEMRKSCSLTGMGGDFLGMLYETLVKNGFKYNEARREWVK